MSTKHVNHITIWSTYNMFLVDTGYDIIIPHPFIYILHLPLPLSVCVNYQPKVRLLTVLCLRFPFKQWKWQESWDLPFPLSLNPMILLFMIELLHHLISIAISGFHVSQPGTVPDQPSYNASEPKPMKIRPQVLKMENTVRYPGTHKSAGDISCWGQKILGLLVLIWRGFWWDG